MRTIAPTDIQVPAARLRMEVDEKLGRESDPVIREIAEWQPHDQPHYEPHDQESSGS